MSLFTNIGGVWKTVTDPQCNIGGVWKKISDGFCNIGGVWKRIYQRAMNLYTAGIENIAWVQGYIDVGTGTASITKNSSYMDVYAVDGSPYDYPSMIYAVTDTQVDITNYTKLCVDWQDTTGTSAGSASGAHILTNKTDRRETALASVRKINAFSRTTDYLDISSLSGNVYIGIESYAYTGYPTTTRIYNVWLE